MLLPGFLYLFMGSDLTEFVEIGQAVEAFAFLILIPFVPASAVQAWAVRHQADQKAAGAARDVL